MTLQSGMFTCIDCNLNITHAWTITLCVDLSRHVSSSLPTAFNLYFNLYFSLHYFLKISNCTKAVCFTRELILISITKSTQEHNDVFIICACVFPLEDARLHLSDRSGLCTRGCGLGTCSTGWEGLHWCRTTGNEKSTVALSYNWKYINRKHPNNR